MESLQIDSSSFKGKSVVSENRAKKADPEKLLCKNSKHNRNVLRNHILRNNLIPYKCAICGCVEWNGKTLSLELDHINGINNDNRLENLRFLCPNCHSQTTTYGSRNCQLAESKYDIPDDLRDLVETKYNEVKSIKKVSSILGIRRSVVTKIITESGQKKSNQKFVIRYDKDRNEIKRFGSLVETAKFLISNDEVNTKRVKTCTREIIKNKDSFWLDSYWIVLDGCGIINNPQLESSLIDSENIVDEAQAKAA